MKMRSMGSVGATINMNIIGELIEVKKTEKGTDYRIEPKECGMTDNKPKTWNEADIAARKRLKDSDKE